MSVERPFVPTSALPEYVRRALEGFEIKYTTEPVDGFAAATDFDSKTIWIPRASWDARDDRVRAGILEHEVNHWLMGYPLLARKLRRDGPVDPLTLNLASDAVIHHHLPHLPELVPGSVTFERLGLPPMGVVPAYHALRNRPPQLCGAGAGQNDDAAAQRCGGLGQCDAGAHPCGSQPDISPGGVIALAEAIARASTARDYPHEHFTQQAWVDPGWGRGVDQAPPPPWVWVLVRLLRGQAAWEPRPVVWREHAALPDCFGIGAERKSLDLDLILDVSGSITDEAVAAAVAALDEKPLRRVRVLVFSTDTVVVDRSDVSTVREVIARIGGGGTCFLPPATQRRAGVPAVWVTDGYPGDGWPKEHPGGDWWVIVDPDGQTPPPSAGVVVWKAAKNEKEGEDDG